MFQFLLGVLLAAFVGYAVWLYNRFVGLQQRADNAFSDVDVQLKRRWDLVPPLVEVVRGYAGHEHDVLAEVVAKRSQAIAARDEALGAERRGEREAGLARALRGIFALVEAYPALKADHNFLALHRALVTTENDIQHARRYHNAVVRDLNTLRQSVPAAIVGAAAGVRLREYFQLHGDERAVPTVDLVESDATSSGAVP